jgi:hypothetical protein
MPTEINALIADARRRFRAAGIEPDEAALDFSPSVSSGGMPHA